MQINSPLFALTFDVDWASDACIEDTIKTISELGVRATFFATGVSAALRQWEARGQIEIGLHPNFRAGSSHGETVEEVVSHVHAIYPEARCFRAHSYWDSTEIALALRRCGMKFDGNLCLYRQANLFPLRHWTGLVRFPTFWEDDIHWTIEGDAWDVDSAYEDFQTPGLKIITAHPAPFAYNVHNIDHYQQIKTKATSATMQEVERDRFTGRGARTFLIELIHKLREAGHRFYTLGELYALFRSDVVSPDRADTGRADAFSDEDHRAYWQASPPERQRILRAMYDKRNVADPYATSRDYNARELEIAAIRRNLPIGKVIDLGCGNGYTLIELAKGSHAKCNFVGVDFSDNLIIGAKKLAESNCVEVNFVCADAIAYISRIEDKSLDAVLTERFLLNMPDVETQQHMIREAARVLRSNGRFLMCEGSADGFDNLNRLRHALGLQTILETSADNLSSIRFRDAEIELFAVRCGLRLIDKLGFSDYFIMSRALHPLLVSPQQPRFKARINDLAREVQDKLPFRPGIGGNTIWVFEKSQPSGARS